MRHCSECTPKQILVWHRLLNQMAYRLRVGVLSPQSCLDSVQVDLYVIWEVSYGRSTTRTSSRSCSLEIRRRMYFNNSNFHHRVLVAGICALLTELMSEMLCHVRNAL